MKAICLVLLLSLSCQSIQEKENTTTDSLTTSFISVLGTVQDGGSPHIGCSKECCKNLWDNPDKTRKVVSLGIVDPESKHTWMLEATPDFPSQIEMLNKLAPFKTAKTPDGIFLTHAHIGHYSGLMYLGREAMSGKGLPVYAMPRMKTFLATNGPWQQLVLLNNIQLQPLQAGSTIKLSTNISITPFLVQHRDEYSETVGYRISGKNKKALFIPDIDKWQKWDRNIVEEIKQVDYAFIDATFYADGEIKGRSMAEIPHPFVVESIAMFDSLPASERTKIHFIHFNHTNPLLKKDSKEYTKVLKKGYRIAEFGQRVDL